MPTPRPRTSRSHATLRGVRDIVIDEEVVLRARPEDVWDFFFSPEGTVLFAGYGPIPGIERIEWLDGSESVVGSRARAHNTDGSTHHELVVRTARPLEYEIAIDGFSSIFRFLVKQVREILRFEPEGGGTRIVRRFVFTPTSPLAVPIALVVRGFFRRAVQRNHEGLVKHFG